MIAAFAALGLLFYDKLDLMVARNIDFEQILPSTINQFVPTGLMGLLLAGLLAAFMSTFAGTLNAAQAYITNDIYLKYINPNAKQKTLKTTNYYVGIIVVVVSIILGINAKNVKQVLQLIVSALWGGYVVSNVLKWYWWRFNSYGYFWGMSSGIVVSSLPMFFTNLLPSLFPDFAPDIRILYYFPIILLASTIASIMGTIFSEPTDQETLKNFYRQIKPWGFWKPVHELVIEEYPQFERNKNFKKDMVNVFVGTIWQTALVAFPIYLVFHQFTAMTICILIAGLLTILLKKNWWNILSEMDKYDHDAIKIK